MKRQTTLPVQLPLDESLADKSSMIQAITLFYHWVDVISQPKLAHNISTTVCKQAYESIAEFMKAATYYRCDRPVLRGSEIAQFYRVQRNLVGRHSLQNITAADQNVFVVGRFIPEVGTELRFCDVWYFNEQRVVKRRETYLATGAELVENASAYHIGKL